MTEKNYFAIKKKEQKTRLKLKTQFLLDLLALLTLVRQPYFCLMTKALDITLNLPIEGTISIIAEFAINLLEYFLCKVQINF